MKVRPVFWYLLLAVLLLAMALNTLTNLNAIKTLQNISPADVEIVSAPKIPYNSSEFLSRLEQTAQKYSLAIISYRLDNPYLYLKSQGAFQEQGLLLDWLEKEDYIKKIENFSIHWQENAPLGQNTMDITLVLSE